MSKRVRVGLIVPDSHHPYVSQAAWGAVIETGRAVKPDFLVNLGDHGDYYCVSRHRKDPNLPHRLETELEASNAALDQLDSLGAKQKFFIAGNHENRLSSYLQERAPAVANLLRVEELTHLEKRGWHFTQYGKVVRVGRTVYAHDPSGHGAYAHIRAALKAGRSIVFGHTHRAGSCYMGTIDGVKRYGMMLGWLGDKERATYYHDLGKEHEWMHSFGIAYVEPNGTTHMQLVPILGKHAVVCLKPKLITARAA